MRPIIFALAMLSAQGIVAWDTGDWSDKWWKQDKAPIKHKHHKHYRHHHHRKQLCEPVVTTTSLTTTTTTTSKPSRPSGIVFIPGGGIPPNIAGDLTSTGADCGNSLTTLAYGRFNAIFFGNFITTEAHEIIGPLAVGGDFSGHAYTINTQHGSDCSDVDNSFGGYALVVGKNDVEYTYSDVHVHGAVFLPNDTNTGNIQQLDGACSVYNNRGVGLMDFKLIQGNAITASQSFALMKPTLHLSSDGTLTRIGSSTTGFDVITFGTCKTCSYGDSFSSPDALYYGIGNWNGPMGMSWPERLIINLPVVHDTTITIQGNQPSLGMRVCSTLLNFYPSDEAGNYREGTFQVDRTTGGRIGGFFLMPEGDIIDENRGAFAGQVIANNYHWLGSGIEIHDYRAAGGDCLTTDICIPVYTNEALVDVPENNDPESSSDSSSNESSTESSSSEENSSSESDSSSSEESSSSSSEESSSSSSVESSSEESSGSSEESSSSSEESSSDDSNNSSEESSSEESSNEESSSEESSSQESSSNSEESSSQESNNSTENVSSQSRSEEHISSNTESSSDSSDGAATGHDDGTSVDSSSTQSSSNGPSSTDDQSSSTTNSQLNSSSESSTANISSTLSESSTSESIPQSSETSSDLESTILSSTISSSTISSSTISSGTVPSGTISSSSGQSDSQVSSPTDCPTETSTECHTHHHHVTTTQYQCDQGFIHDEEVLVCEHDSHHHHRKDYYAGDDDDNFENDVEFGLYDYNRFDEECDIDHGVVNYDKDEYEYNHYKYKGKKHHDNDDEEEDDEEEDEEDEDDDEDEDEDEDENKDEDEDDDK